MGTYCNADNFITIRYASDYEEKWHNSAGNFRLACFSMLLFAPSFGWGESGRHKVEGRLSAASRESFSILRCWCSWAGKMVLKPFGKATLKRAQR